MVQPPSLLLGRSQRTMERDLEIGRQIQASFLPSSLPHPEGWDIAHLFEPSREVSGDFYDGFSMSNGKRIGLVIADVCDKGVGAALFMALFRTLIHAFAEQHTSLGWIDVLSGDTSTLAVQDRSVSQRRNRLSTGATALRNAMGQTNNYIAKNHGDSNMFATVFFGVLDPETGNLTYINAGHVPPLQVRSGQVVTCLMPTGPALGLFPDQEYAIEQVVLQPGDLLMAYTDGVTEAQNNEEQFFGESRLETMVCEPGGAEEILNRIQTQLHVYLGDQHPSDDITMLAIRRLK